VEKGGGAKPPLNIPLAPEKPDGLVV